MEMEIEHTYLVAVKLSEQDCNAIYKILGHMKTSVMIDTFNITKQEDANTITPFLDILRQFER